MINKCIGCGCELQSDDPKKFGYIDPKHLTREDRLCQRCFKIRNYNENNLMVKSNEDYFTALDEINKKDVLIIWVIDLFDLNGSIITGLKRRIPNKDIMILGTKRDLLPDTLSNEKLLLGIKEILKQEDIKPLGISVISHKGRVGMDECLEVIDHLRKGRDIAIIGSSNVGKSTFINALLKKTTLTTSFYPGTTLDIVEIDLDDHKLYDTPGIMLSNNILNYVAPSDLKYVVPAKKVKSLIYQLKDKQSIYVGGLARIDFLEAKPRVCVGYFSDKLKLHRTKLENADELFEKHKNNLLVPVCQNCLSIADFKTHDFHIKEKKVDIVINGLGWFCLSGEIGHIQVKVFNNVKVEKRKAFI